MIDISKIICDEFEIRQNQVDNVIKLLDEGSTVPFISRYRKEMTGNLDELQIKNINDRNEYLKQLEERKETILKTIEEQGKLTPELKKKIKDTFKKNELEDLYAPYKPKKRTRASIAKEKGLEPLAELIYGQNISEGSFEEYSKKFLSKKLQVNTIEEALQGAQDIIAEKISENADLKQKIRGIIWEEGSFCSRVTKSKVKEKSKFEMYYDFKEKLLSIPPHRILGMRRGEKEKFLILDVSAPTEKIILLMQKEIITNEKNIFIDCLKNAIEDSYKRLIKSSLDVEIRLDLKEKADMSSIKVFSENLKELLLSAPLGSKTVLAIDPGIRTGSKTVVLSNTGDFVNFNVLYTRNANEIVKSSKVLLELIKKHNIKFIAIGNGTGGRDIKKIITGILKNENITDYNIIMVNESGASIYSASTIAREEFPDLDVTVRGAISIGRRLQDPLAELVKIDPKSIGVGQYQHDVNQKLLQKELDDVVSSAVNYVGVNINTASYSLLEYVSGITNKIAKNIMEYRKVNGEFKNRKEILKVKGLGPKAFEQAAGFLKISNGKNKLDNTAVHPESYYIVEEICKTLKITLEELLSNSEHLDKINALDFIKDIGEYTFNDIIEELKKPGRDPRSEFINPEFNDNINEIKDLKKDMILNGVITNITNFGAFCDIGVHQDGLIHISQMSYGYVSNPMEILKVGQLVKVKIIEIDIDRNRINLSMKLDDSKQKSQPKKKKIIKPQKMQIADDNPFKVLEQLL